MGSTEKSISKLINANPMPLPLWWKKEMGSNKEWGSQRTWRKKILALLEMLWITHAIMMTKTEMIYVMKPVFLKRQ